MKKFELKVFSCGDLFTNSYLIFNRDQKKGFIVDAPYPLRELEKFIKKETIEILFIALTHAHFDHIGGLDGFPQKFYLHQGDLGLLKDVSLNGSSLFGRPVVIEREPAVYGNSPVRFDARDLCVIHTPGHTPGSVSLKLGDWLFSGDTLFFDSVGRTDIPLGSSEILLKSIKEKLLSLPDETIVYPGHGPSTTLGREKKHNPFIAGKL